MRPLLQQNDSGEVGADGIRWVCHCHQPQHQVTRYTGTINHWASKGLTNNCVFLLYVFICISLANAFFLPFTATSNLEVENPVRFGFRSMVMA